MNCKCNFFIDLCNVLEHKETGPVDGKILFKKPTKRKSEGEQDSKDKSTAKQKKKKGITTKPSLLSFNDEDEDAWNKFVIVRN